MSLHALHGPHSVHALGGVRAALLQVESVPDVGAGEVVGGSALGAFLGTLVVGAILVALVPGSVERLTASVADEPIASLVYGLLALLALVVVVVALALTLVGIPVALLLVFLAWLTWVVGATIGYLAIADGLVDHEGGWLVALLVAAVINGALTLTAVGGVVSFAVGAAGFGAVLRNA